MMKRKSPTILIGAATLAVMLHIPAPAAAREETRRIDASPEGTVTINNPRGNVTIIGWDRDEVSVTGRLGAEIRRLTCTRSGNEILIGVVSDANPEQAVGADLEVHVPLHSRIDVRTFQSPIGVSGVSGPIDLESMSGRIVITGEPRLVRAQCMSCDMDIQAESEVIRAESVGGAISVKEARGVVDISTVSGNLTLVSGGEAPECPSGKGVSMSTITGNIAYTGSLCDDSSLFLETHSGAIDLHVPPTMNADLDVLCYSCKIDNGSTPKLVPTLDAEGRAQEYRVIRGSGGGQVKVRSFSGPVTIRHDR